jgi:putative endonuclease
MKTKKNYYVYIMTNKVNTTLYTGVTNNLQRRVLEHKKGGNKGFTKKYKISKLVYYEIADSPDSAIFREKQIKGGSRKNKIALINRKKPEWNDLYDEFYS